MPRAKAPRWTSREVAILREFYPDGGLNAVVDQLADRSWRAIYMKAHKLGLNTTALPAAPRSTLQGEQLTEAIRLREVERWGYARIGATFGISESAASNAIIIAQCARRGFTPAERDEHGRLTPDGLARLRWMLKKGLRAIDIQTRLGLSASRVAEERRRYNRDLKAKGAAPLPPPGNGDTYSGASVSKSSKAQVEQLLIEGYGSKLISKQTGVSNTTIGRIRTRLIKRLKRQGKTLTGCDDRGHRIAVKDSVHFVPATIIEALEHRLLNRMPVLRAAHEVGIGTSTAYKLRDTLAERLRAAGDLLPSPKLPGRTHRQAAKWLPNAHRARFFELVREHGFDDGKQMLQAELAQTRRAEAARPRTFEETLAKVAAGARLVTVTPLRRPDPTMTLGGVATGTL